MQSCTTINSSSVTDSRGTTRYLDRLWAHSVASGGNSAEDLSFKFALGEIRIYRILGDAARIPDARGV